MEEKFIPEEAKAFKAEKPEAVSLEQRIEKIRAKYPHSSDAFSYGEYHQAGLRSDGKNLSDFSAEIERKACWVETNCTGVFNNKSEGITEKMWGCSVVFFETTKGKKIMSHMTPNGIVGFSYRDFPEADRQKYVSVAVDRVTASLTSEEMQGAFGTIVCNPADEAYNPEINKFHIANRKKEWERLRETFASKGIKLNIVELPLDETTIYHDPKKAHQLFVIGRPTKIGEEGRLEVNGNETQEFWINTGAGAADQFIERKALTP